MPSISIQKKQEFKFYFYLVTGIIGLFLYFKNNGTLIEALIWFCIFLIAARIAGVGYHRWLAHRAIEPKIVGKIILLYFMIASNVARPIDYVIAHRTHHKYPDTTKDPHPPSIGLWNMILGRLNSITLTVPVRDVYRNTLVMFVNRNFLKLHILHLFLFYILCPNIFFLSFALFNLADIIFSALFNYYSHKDGNPRNLPCITNFSIFPGEYLHSNHHLNPGNSNYGGNKWYNFDLIYQVTRLLFKKKITNQ